MQLQEMYQDAKSKVIHDCIKCGNCISQCKAIELTSQQFDVYRTQENIIRYLDGFDALTEEGQLKVNACMSCFGCLDIPCPIGVSSMTINELVRWSLTDKTTSPTYDEIFATQHRLAREGTTPDEFQRIMTPDRKKSDILFFPGCNVYNQPDKLLNALTIMDEIGKDYSFAPGLEYCCGIARGYIGDAEWYESSAGKLVALAEELSIKTMVLWCPTCLCAFEDKINNCFKTSFRCISFSEYVYENISKLSFPNAQPQQITYHEPCKTAYMGLDLYVRRILTAIPGTELIEMAHHGHDTICCGCDAVANAPEIGNSITQKRLEEAAATGCDILIDTCHHCHWVFSAAKKTFLKDNSAVCKLNIENYATYITAAMGRSRPDSLL